MSETTLQVYFCMNFSDDIQATSEICLCDIPHTNKLPGCNLLGLSVIPVAQNVAHPLVVGKVMGSNLGPTPLHNLRR